MAQVAPPQKYVGRTGRPQGERARRRGGKLRSAASARGFAQGGAHGGPKSFCAAVDAATRARCPIDEGVSFGALKSELAWPEGDAQRFAILEAGLAGSKNAHQAADASAQAAL